jgi:hypothetical protein
MVDLHPIFEAFVKLGVTIRNHVEVLKSSDDVSLSDGLKDWETMLQKAKAQNGWFTREAVLHALDQWGRLLRKTELRNWLDAYELKTIGGQTVALIMAGNIPLVGMHDFLTTLITGNKALVKLSSNDTVLLPFLAEKLIAEYPLLSEQIQFTEGTLGTYDKVIATGSNNTSRYFEHYFGKKPHIIRKNRNAVAVLDGREDADSLRALGVDVFQYFGLGCRSVSKLYLPENYDFDPLFNALYDYREIIQHQKYGNNYDYNKAVYLMSKSQMLDNGFLLLKEDSGLSSPIGVLFFEYYSAPDTLRKELGARADNIQCIVSNGLHDKDIPFGHSQQPGLSDYADGVDTVAFLLQP